MATGTANAAPAAAATATAADGHPRGEAARAPRLSFFRGQHAHAGAARAGRALDLPVHLHHRHELLAGGADRRDLASTGSGLDNWTRLFSDAAVGASWLRSILYFVLTVGLEMILGIAIALCVHEIGVGQEHRALADPHADVHGAGDRRPARPLPDRLDLRPLRLGAEGDRPLSTATSSAAPTVGVPGGDADGRVGVDAADRADRAGRAHLDARARCSRPPRSTARATAAPAPHRAADDRRA